MVSLSQQQQRTLGFLKPDVTDRKSDLMALIKSNDLWKVTFEQELILSLGEAKALYPQGEDATWLSSHPIYVFILEGVDVVKNWKEYVGPLDSEVAKQDSPQSLRATFGLDSLRNVCHASVSDKQAHHDLVWLQGLVVDDLSIQQTASPDMYDDENATSASSSEHSVKSNTVSKLSKLKKPTTTRIGKVASSKPASTLGKKTSTTSSNNSSSSSSSESKKKPPTTSTAAKQATIVPPRPKSSLGTRAATPNSAKTNSKLPPTTTSGKTQKISAPTATKKSIPTAGSAKSVTPVKSIKPPSSSAAPTKLGPLRNSKAPAGNGRKDLKSSRISSRSELLNKSSSPDSVATMGPSTSKRLSNTGGISKNTPGISVLTGRTRKHSRLEKRKDINGTITKDTTTTTTAHIVTVDDHPHTQPTEPSDDNIVPASDNQSNTPTNGDDCIETKTTQIVEDDLVTAEIKTTVNDIALENNDINNNNHTPYATESVNTLASASTSCSQHTMDSDHDAEVAAATSGATSATTISTMKLATTTTTTAAAAAAAATAAATTTATTTTINNKGTCPRIDSPNDMMDRRRSSSFSPSSVASSLARPETPEVDNLRQRFESLATNNNKTPGSTITTGTTTSQSRRTSSITPEMALRIKELKPKDPAGSRVKSMVEFFMDENIHKWEF